MTRKEFLYSAGAFAASTPLAGLACECGSPDDSRYVRLQKAIDEVTPADFATYLADRAEPKFEVFRVLDAAFDRVLAEVRETVVTDKPAVWLVYNMGCIVKTKQTCFSIDLKHRKGEDFAPLLDFALITHNHGDHFTEPFYRAMNGAHKVVISNFKDNYGAWRRPATGGYTRAVKTFQIKDVTIRTALTDHNDYLVDFTTAFDIRIGDYTIFHSGDCSNVAKLNPTVRPDLWVVHPICGMSVADGVRKFHPKRTAIAHLNEMGHAKGDARWTWKQGFEEQEKVRKAGGAAFVPIWGDRIV